MVKGQEQSRWLRDYGSGVVRGGLPTTLCTVSGSNKNKMESQVTYFLITGKKE